MNNDYKECEGVKEERWEAEKGDLLAVKDETNWMN